MAGQDAKGVIDLVPSATHKSNGTVVEYEAPQSGDFTLHLTKRSFLLRAESPADARLWGAAVDSWINGSTKPEVVVSN